MTRAVAALALSGGAAAAFLIPGDARSLEYDRAALAGGEVWRLLTGHFTHWSAEHLAWDLLAFVALGVLCERESRVRFLACVGGAALAVSLTLWWAMPGLERYRGLSGLDSALFVLLAVSLMRHGDSRRIFAGACALVAFLAKLAWEGATGGALFVHDPGATTVPLVHLAGALVGLAVGAVPLSPPVSDAGGGPPGHRASPLPNGRGAASAWFIGIRGAGCAVCLAMLLSACAKPADMLLWQASMRGQVDEMELFLQQGADPNYVRGGHSILMRLARRGRADIAEILIERGATVNFKGKDGASALTVAAEHGNTGVARVLLAKGADVNIRNNHGNTALMYAAQYGHPDMVRLLLAAGADVTPKDRDGDSALGLARLIETARLLREAGARE